MGCTQSKIENEEAVTRCKDRKLFMKEAVSARNAFAAAHSAYTMSLKNTGAALSDYAHGEVQNPQNIALNDHTSQALPPPPSAAPQPPMDPLVPPPPPPNMSEPFHPIQRATSLPAINLSERKEKEFREGNDVAAATIVEEDDEEEGVESSHEKLITRKRSSGRNRGGGGGGGEQQSAAAENSRAVQAPPQQDSAWDYFFPPMENMPGPTLEVKEEKEVIEQKVFNEMPKRVEEATAEAVVEPPSMAEEKRKVVEEKVEAPPPPPLESVGGRSLKKGKAGGGTGGMVEKRVAKGGVNLLQVFVELDDHFLKASESAHEVSKMLEATRLHYHSNFADNRGNLLWRIGF